MSDGDITTMRRITVSILCVMASFALFASLVVTQPWTPISVMVDARSPVYMRESGVRLATGYHLLWWADVVPAYNQQ